MFDFENEARAYHAKMHGDKYPRLKAWDFLWDYIQSLENWSDLASDKNIRNTALNIGFYLANWGMFRGSSELSRVNVSFFEDLSGHLFTDSPHGLWNLRLVEFKGKSSPAAELFDQGLQHIKCFGKGRVSWTETLTSKLLLGVWGQCPAKDRYFNIGTSTFNKSSAIKISGIISGNYLSNLNMIRQKQSWPALEFKTPAKNRYPTGKVIDMAFFQHGWSSA